jgi:hypothetical protein
MPTLSISNKRKSNKRWFSSAHIDSTESLSFELHYYAGYNLAKNLRVFIDNLNGKILRNGEKLKVYGKIEANNLDTSRGEVEVVADEHIRLKLPDFVAGSPKLVVNDLQKHLLLFIHV